MNIEVQCGQCLKNFAAPDKLAGKRVKCPGCGEPIASRRLPQPTSSSIYYHPMGNR